MGCLLKTSFANRRFEPPPLSYCTSPLGVADCFQKSFCAFPLLPLPPQSPSWTRPSRLASRPVSADAVGGQVFRWPPSVVLRAIAIPSDAVDRRTRLGLAMDDDTLYGAFHVGF